MLTLPMTYLTSEIDYNPMTGILTWNKTSENQMRVAGTECGRPDRSGYLGTYKEPDVAAKVYAEAAKAAFGEFSFISRPDVPS
ncbi:hypothetical protein [Rugamonas sp.]|uniref:hypothetical protein n=1 Tax=Rugamonas sp. TaxID=1926287 RepID=UPI0025FE37FF|nr:hypothetical protein [Rugamonas sp.]